MQKMIIGAIIAIALICSESRAETLTVSAGGPDSPSYGSIWTDTGINLDGGNFATLSGASGNWCWDVNAGAIGCSGPSGVNAGDSTTWIGDLSGELIGFVGSVDPNSLRFSPPLSGDFFDVGSNTVTASGPGELWLGINDDYNCGGCEGDNAGYVTVNVATPEPATLLLLCSGLTGFVATKRFRSARP